ncbi:MAG TPA: hypothetical protein VFE28_03895 [Candidatus Krumholzibacteria bacterium]|nr:hypothetical protein [Candidatus Krumholzibacteria bacterium]
MHWSARVGSRRLLRCFAVGFACFLGASTLSLSSCDECATTGPPDPPPVLECNGPVTVTVSPGMTPTFSWTPDCTLGRLIVEAGPGEEYWGTETLGTNLYRSPIVYGVHPPGSVEQQIPEPLTPGMVFRVSVFYWATADPNSLDAGGRLIGQAEFTPMVDSLGVRNE